MSIRPAVPAVLVAVAFAFLPSAARAGLPSPPNCVVENALIGSWNGVGIPTGVQPCGPFHPELMLVIVRDIANLPVPGAVVKFNFAGSGLRLHTAQNPGVTNACNIESAAYTADANGVVQVSLRFAGTSDLPAVSVTADGVFLATVPARSPDYNGDGVVGLSDLSIFASDYLDPLAGHPRSDFDNCPTTKLTDLAYFAGQYQASTGQPPAPLCP